MAQCKSVKDEVKQHMEKIDVVIDELKHERAEFKLKATRTQQENQKVCPSLAS